MANRGRPRGPSKQVSKWLDEIASRLARDPGLSPNSIIVSLCPCNTDMENHRRRLHRWWKRQGEERLAAARERLEEKNARRVVPRMNVDLSHLGISGATFGLAARAKEMEAALGLAPSIREMIDQTAGVQALIAQADAHREMMKEIERITDPLKEIRESMAFAGLFR